MKKVWKRVGGCVGAYSMRDLFKSSKVLPQQPKMHFFPNFWEDYWKKVLIKGCWLPRPHHVPWRARYSRPSVTTHGLPRSRLDQARHELFVPIFSLPWLNTNIQIWQILLVWFLTTVFNWALHLLVVESARRYYPRSVSSTWALDPILSKKVAVNTISSPLFTFVKKCIFQKDFFSNTKANCPLLPARESMESAPDLVSFLFQAACLAAWLVRENL